MPTSIGQSAPALKARFVMPNLEVTRTVAEGRSTPVVRWIVTVDGTTLRRGGTSARARTAKTWVGSQGSLICRWNFEA